jgi:hypothetical protein
MQHLQRRWRPAVPLSLFGAVVSAAIGAASAPAGEGPNIAATRAQLELSDAPDRAMNVLAVVNELKTRPSDRPAKPARVTMVGQIGGMPNLWPDTHPDFPWFAGQASFFLVDSKVAAQFADHARNHGGSHQCTFCKSLAAKNAQAVAVVSLIDEQGKVLRIDSRQLLGLREGQTVTVCGKAELLGGTVLVVHADGIYPGGPRVARKPSR